MKPFTLVYFILSIVLYFVALPFLVYLSFKKKYKESIPARFFLFNNSPFSSKESIWFHVCSLGEARALKPILKELGDLDVKITTITHTGQNEAKKYKAEVRYLPYEMFLPFWMTKQKILVVLEAEFWFMLFTVAQLKKTRIILLNGRISDKSVKKYLQFAWFYKKFFSTIEMIYAQSELDKNRFIALGARNIEVIGNIKLSAEINKSRDYVKLDVELIVAGSTHEGEEESVLKSFIQYRKHSDAKLIVVPRHPERFESVYTLMQIFTKDNDLSISRFTDTNEFKTDIILLDKMGELNNIYAISDIAILGGAFRNDVGGHNPLEPAYFGCKIITGKHFFHQKELFKYVHHVQYVEADEIHKALKDSKNLPSSRVDETINLESVINRIKNNPK
ncbi:MAG: 3-deoxy-D-manno-octulosonic acid transferase [Sulfurimonas sp.]|nr:MAG: 3-deoxy-D-manno-octulosonic acid transferase [Sulfurimonas sp.]